MAVWNSKCKGKKNLTTEEKTKPPADLFTIMNDNHSILTVAMANKLSHPTLILIGENFFVICDKIYIPVNELNCFI